MGRGARRRCRRPAARAPVLRSTRPWCALGLVAIPWQAHRQFTSVYAGRIPGLGATRGEQAGFLDPSRDPVYRWPGLRRLAAGPSEPPSKADIAPRRRPPGRTCVVPPVGPPEGRHLHALVATGVLPQDTHVAVSAVGAIPYFSGLRVLDRLGLTDRVVAKSAPGDLRVLAHDRHATLDYAAASGVDFWSEHPVHLLMREDDDNLIFMLEDARATGAPVYFADVGSGEYLVAQLPQGLAKTAARFPKLDLHAASDAAGYGALLDAVIAAHRHELSAHPSAREARVSLGSALAARGLDDEALAIFAGWPARTTPTAGTTSGRFSRGAERMPRPPTRSGTRWLSIRRWIRHATISGSRWRARAARRSDRGAA